MTMGICGNLRFKTTQERLDIGHTFRVAVIHLFGVTDNKKIYFFMG